MKPAIAWPSPTGRFASPARSDAPSTSSPTRADVAASPLNRGRRDALRAAVGACGLALSPALFATPALASMGTRRFGLMRDGSDIGFHEITAAKSGDDVQVTIEIEIGVRVLGIRVYAYEHRNVELWRGGQLISLDAQTNDDGEEAFARVRATGDGYTIEGSGYSGPAPGDIAPTSYWNYKNFATTRWVSTQSGKLFDMRFAQSAGPNGLERWDISGGFESTLFYDAEGEWRGCEFDARGTPIIYEQTQPGPRLGLLV